MPSIRPPRPHWPPLLILLVLAGLAAPAVAQPTGVEVEIELVASGFDRALGLTHAGDGSGRLFVIEQLGAVRVIRNGQVEPEPFLDLRDTVACCGENGLLGLAFHPRFPADDRIFVHYSGSGGETRIVEMRTTAGGERADPSTARTLLTVAQPFQNHNGGQIGFGPDGFLYIGLGDGGSGGDPLGHAQDVTTLLGAILRIDVDSRAEAEPRLPYAIPPDNPDFAGVPGARREIWAYGLRNPWRFSFDRATGDLFVADVGQNAWEEIDLLPPGSAGANLGWNHKEGDHCFDPPSGCRQEGLVDPILEYSHSTGCSVTGGYRYRGAASPALHGVYVYGDLCSGRIWGATPVAGGGVGGAWAETELLDVDFLLTSFGEDEAGEIHVVDGAVAPGGRVLRLQATGSGGGGGGGGEEECPEPFDGPEPPAGDWMASPQVPGFRVQARITAQDGTEPPVRREGACLPETLCVSGALPGRSELFVRVIGPRPNGKLWPVLVRFTTSRVEVWIEQASTCEGRYYDLPATTPGETALGGLIDRDGFDP